MTRVLAALLVLAAAGALLPAPAAAAAPVATIQIDGVISPVTVRLVEAAVRRGLVGADLRPGWVVPP